MNGGAAKTLRGQSRKPGEPERAYEIANKSRPVRGTPPAPGMAAPTVQPPGTFRLVKDCDRARYKRLKRAYKRGEVTL